MLGPDVVRCLSGDMAVHGGDGSRGYALRITDVVDRPNRRDEAQNERSDDNNESSSASTPQTADSDPRHEFVSVDITSRAEVVAAAEGTDVIVICSVVRAHDTLCFEVNTKGVLHACEAAVASGHRRLVNTGPWTVVGGHYRNWHHNLNEDMPPQSGLDLYSFSKGLGHEISRVFTMNHVSRHNTAAVWVAFSPSGLHSSQDGSDIFVDRQYQLLYIVTSIAFATCVFLSGLIFAYVK